MNDAPADDIAYYNADTARRAIAILRDTPGPLTARDVTSGTMLQNIDAVAANLRILTAHGLITTATPNDIGTPRWQAVRS